MNNKILYLIACCVIVILAYLFDSVVIITSSIFLFVAIRYEKWRFSRRVLRILSKNYDLPQLGIRTGDNPVYNEAIKQLGKQLDEALDPTIKEKIAPLPQSEKKIKPVIIENLLIEWKRFLILNTLIPSIQMYSEEAEMYIEEVQEIWDQMINITREDAEFQKKFFDMHLTHHSKYHDAITDKTKDKEWFCFLYSRLFHVTDCSRLLWEIYFSEPLEFEKIDKFRHLSTDKLKQFFYPFVQHKNPLVETLTQQLIIQIKQQIQRLDEHVNDHGKSIRKYKKKFRSWRRIPSKQRDLWSTQTALFFSLYQPDKFDNYRHWINAHSQSASGEGGGGDGDGGGGDGGGGDGGGGE